MIDWEKAKLTDGEKRQIPQGFHYLLEYKEELDYLLDAQLAKIKAMVEADRVAELEKWKQELNEAIVLHSEIKSNGNVVVKGGAIQVILVKLIKEQQSCKSTLTEQGFKVEE